MADCERMMKEALDMISWLDNIRIEQSKAPMFYSKKNVAASMRGASDNMLELKELLKNEGSYLYNRYKEALDPALKSQNYSKLIQFKDVVSLEILRIVSRNMEKGLCQSDYD